MKADADFEHEMREVPESLKHSLESLEEMGEATLRLKFHAIRWKGSVAQRYLDGFLSCL